MNRTAINAQISAAIRVRQNGQWRDAEAKLDWLYDRRDELPTDCLAYVLAIQATFAEQEGDWLRARSLYADARRLYERCNAPGNADAATRGWERCASRILGVEAGEVYEEIERRKVG